MQDYLYNFRVEFFGDYSKQIINLDVSIKKGYTTFSDKFKNISEKLFSTNPLLGIDKRYIQVLFLFKKLEKLKPILINNLKQTERDFRNKKICFQVTGHHISWSRGSKKSNVNNFIIFRGIFFFDSMISVYLQYTHHNSIWVTIFF